MESASDLTESRTTIGNATNLVERSNRSEESNRQPQIFVKDRQPAYVRFERYTSGPLFLEKKECTRRAQRLYQLRCRSREAPHRDVFPFRTSGVNLRLAFEREVHLDSLE